MAAINMAKAREALELCVSKLCEQCKKAHELQFRSPVCCESWCEPVRTARAVLAAPARNCDVYDAKTAEKEFVRQTGSKSIRTKSVRWLYAPANGGNGDVK